MANSFDPQGEFFCIQWFLILSLVSQNLICLCVASTTNILANNSTAPLHFPLHKSVIIPELCVKWKQTTLCLQEFLSCLIVGATVTERQKQTCVCYFLFWPPGSSCLFRTVLVSHYLIIKFTVNARPSLSYFNPRFFCWIEFWVNRVISFTINSLLPVTRQYTPGTIGQL